MSSPGIRNRRLFRGSAGRPPGGLPDWRNRWDRSPDSPGACREMQSCSRRDNHLSHTPGAPDTYHESRALMAGWGSRGRAVAAISWLRPWQTPATRSPSYPRRLLRNTRKTGRVRATPAGSSLIWWWRETAPFALLRNSPHNGRLRTARPREFLPGLEARPLAPVRLLPKSSRPYPAKRRSAHLPDSGQPMSPGNVP